MLKNVQYSEKGQFKAKTEHLRDICSFYLYEHLIFYRLIILKPKPFLGVLLEKALDRLISFKIIIYNFLNSIIQCVFF